MITVESVCSFCGNVKEEYVDLGCRYNFKEVVLGGKIVV